MGSEMHRQTTRQTYSADTQCWTLSASLANACDALCCRDALVLAGQNKVKTSNLADVIQTLKSAVAEGTFE